MEVGGRPSPTTCGGVMASGRPGPAASVPACSNVAGVPEVAAEVGDAGAEVVSVKGL
jgi:hypothetical protein